MKFCSLFISVILLFNLSSCSEKKTEKYYDKVFYGMHTYVTVRIASTSDSESENEKLSKECEKIFLDFEKKISRTYDLSDVFALNENIDTLVDADNDLVTLFNLSYRISDMTDGAFDSTVGPLTELWNITGGGPVPEKTKISEALEHIGYDKFSIEDKNIVKNDSKAKLDFGGIGKGYGLQLMLEYLSDKSDAYGLISVGGNIGVFGQKPEREFFKIGITSPEDADSVVGYIFIDSGFVSVSGDYQRYFEENGKRYHHILDSKNGYPVENGIRSTVVYCKNGALADALSTALFVMGSERALEFYKSSDLTFEAVFITDNKEIILTPGLVVGENVDITDKSYTVIQK